MPDTIYDDLKEQGLILSEGAVLTLPPIRPPKPTLAKKLVSSVVPDIGFKLPPGPHPLVILPILNSAVIIGRANTLICYKFEIDKETSRPIFQPPKVQNLPFVIRKLHLCDSKFLNDRGEVPFLIESDDRLVLFYIDLKEYKLTEKNQLRFSNLFSVRFICEKEVLIMTRQFQLLQFTIQSGKIKLKNKKISANLSQLPSNQYVHHCQIVGSIDEEQDSTVTIFYLIKKIPSNGKNAEQDSKFQILQVKEYNRTFEGRIEPLEEQYTVISNTHSSVLPDNFEIWNFDTFYCIETKFQILILKKKFKKYLFIDNVMENLNDCNLRINPGAVISSHNQSVMELSVIQFGDPKCFSRILDTIDLKVAAGMALKLVWPFMNEKETCLMVAFEKQKTISFHNLIKMKPMEKMLEVVNNIEDKRNISMVQQIAINLGINKRDFYLTLWQSSSRQIADIYTFLIPCCDVPSIKKQIRLTMRRKKIPVVEFIRILQRLSTLIKSELKTNLSQTMLKQYIKNDFLLRKVKLKQKQKSMDHRDLQKVYDNSIVDIFAEIVKNHLCPQEKKVDPLHAMVDPPDPEVMDLRHVFQEFRIVILENYKKFIVDFLAQFSYDKIHMVIKQYSGILLPRFPFELDMVMHESDYKTEEELKLKMLQNSNGQNLWFSNMTSVEFSRQMSKQRIQRQLHEYYPTSKISDAINTLVNSAYGASEKLKKHGLISCSIGEYREKLKDIYNTKLFLKVCEYANEKEDYDQDQLSAQLVEIFKKENKLTGDAYETVRLYASMHKFMLKNDFCEKKNSQHGGFTTEELMEFNNEDLIALFFLENRQRKQFIFNQFRDLYVKLYGNPDKFNDAIRQFIHSENCSRIELQIFIKEVTNKGTEFQIANQELIELLIEGFCMKLEIREDTDTKHFIELMEEIELQMDKGMKMNKIIQIRRCLGILSVFNCQKLTYYDMLQYQHNNKIFKILLQKYFNQECKRDSVRIEDEQISLDYCRNMLTVLLYILQTIYYDVSEKDLLLTYGEMLIQWKQFDVIKGILYDEQVLEKLKIEKEPYIQELVQNALNTIYHDDTIAYDEEVKRQIEDILDILPENNEFFKKKQHTKLQLVQIFEEWGVVIKPNMIDLVCYNWVDDHGKEEFVADIFNDYLSQLTFDNFKAIYGYLTIATSTEPIESEEALLENPQFASLALKFAQRLLNSGRYQEIIEILAFVKRIPDTKIQYELVTEVFLKEMVRIYPEERLMQGKQVIEYFTQNYNDDKVMADIFARNFEDIHFNIEVEREDTILLLDQYATFKKEKGLIDLQLVWAVVEGYMNERRDIPLIATSYHEELYYCYYFLLTSLRSPRTGLQKLDRISYNLEMITELLFRFQACVDNNPGLWVINTHYFFRCFLKGLLLIAVVRIVKEGHDEKGIIKQKSNERNLQNIKNQLKQNKAANKDILDVLAKVEPFIKYNTKKSEKQLRYEKEKFKEQSNLPKKDENEEKPVEQTKNNATMNLKVMREMKYEYTQMSNLSVDIISQKDVLNAIYNRVYEDKQQARKAKRDATSSAASNPLFLTSITGHRKEAVQNDIIEKLPKNGADEILKAYPRDEIINAVRGFYDDRVKTFNQVVEMLEALRLGEHRKMNMCRMIKYREHQIPQEDLQRVFPFDFFLSGEGMSEQDFVDYAYREISENIQQLFIQKNTEYIKAMAHFVSGCLETSSVLERVYVDTLIYIAKNCNFASNQIVRYRTLMEMISPEVMKENVTRVIQSCRSREDMYPYVKKELEIWAKFNFSDDTALLTQIRKS